MSSAFNHAFTPPQLCACNTQLSLLLDNETFDEQEIEKIIGERANLVDSLLNSLDEQQRRCFAAFEIKTNDAILAIVDAKRSAVQIELGQVSKSSKAIKKYHQV